jgi:DNA-binding protein H-NS
MLALGFKVILEIEAQNLISYYKNGTHKMNLDDLSFEELKSLQNDVTVALYNFEKRKKAEALAEIKSLAHAKGFSLDELLGGEAAKGKRAPAVAKYADPANPDNTWSGRGRKPKWLVAQIENGKTVEDFAI